MARSGWRRARRVAALALLSAVLVAPAVSCGRSADGQPEASYCALMSDSVGLYAGNPVTQMGYQIGNVTHITPEASHVRVDFRVTQQRRLPHDVRAVIRSTSILADRSLELVGNPAPGTQLGGGECIPLARTSTPKSLSEVIGSASNFVNAITPSGSTNVGDVVRGLDQSLHGNGAAIRQLLTSTSGVLDSPDQAISDIGSVIANLAQLTTTLTEIRGPLKEILTNAEMNTGDVGQALYGGAQVLGGIRPIIQLAGDVELELGDEIQFTLDATSVASRKFSAHAPWLADLLKPVPWWVNTLANHYNNRGFHITYRPPLYRIRTPNGLAQCGIMNASMPGSCADVAGEPYAVDVALLQYVLSQAKR